jgi:uncharacterized protein YdeI (YjbR/CyaY-like superfamily)
MNPLNLLYVSNRKDWRRWLKDNHLTEKEIWLVYYKKHTGKDRVPYNDAVEEALCFGWIDSIIRRLDDERFAQKFTPRKDTSKWSESNKMRIAKLEIMDLMTSEGLKKVEIAKATGKWNENIEHPFIDKIHPQFETALKNNPLALTNFENLAPSYKRNYNGWIRAAKKEETRRKRIEEAVNLLKENRKLGMK